MSTAVKNIKSPAHVHKIVVSLIEGLKKHETIDRGKIDPAHLEILDAHAREVFGNDDCEVLSYEGCNSCCADGISGSLAHTTCGDMCDKVCGDEPCH